MEASILLIESFKEGTEYLNLLSTKTESDFYETIKIMFNNFHSKFPLQEHLINPDFIKSFVSNDGLNHLGILLHTWNSINLSFLNKLVEPPVFYEPISKIPFNFTLKKKNSSSLCKPFDLHILIEFLMYKLPSDYIISSKFWTFLHSYKWLTIQPFVIHTETTYLTGHSVPNLIYNPFKPILEYPGYKASSDIDAELLENRYETRHINYTGVPDILWKRKEIRKIMIEDPIFKDCEIKFLIGDFIDYKKELKTQFIELFETWKSEHISLLKDFSSTFITTFIKNTFTDNRPIRKIILDDKEIPLIQPITIDEWFAIKNPIDFSIIFINSIKLLIDKNNKIYSFSDNSLLGEAILKNGYIQVVFD